MRKQIEPTPIVHKYGIKPPRSADVSKDVGDLSSAKDTRCHASPVTYSKCDPDRDGRASLHKHCLPLSMRRRCPCGAISGVAWGGGAITLSMASAVISIPTETAICFTFEVIRSGHGLRRNASSRSASSGSTARTKERTTLIVCRRRQKPRQSAR